MNEKRSIIDILSRYILSSKTLGFFQSGISSRNVFNIQCYDNSAFSMKLSVENCIRNWKIMNYNKAIISCHQGRRQDLFLLCKIFQLLHKLLKGCLL